PDRPRDPAPCHEGGRRRCTVCSSDTRPARPSREARRPLNRLQAHGTGRTSRPVFFCASPTCARSPVAANRGRKERKAFSPDTFPKFPVPVRKFPVPERSIRGGATQKSLQVLAKLGFPRIEERIVKKIPCF